MLAAHPSSIELSRLHSSTYSRFLTEESPASSQQNVTTDALPTPHSTDDAALAAVKPRWRRDLYALLEQPRSSPAAFMVHMLMLFLILLSALVTVLETVPAFHTISTRVWFGLETSLVAIFTLEYIARCFAWSSTWIGLLRWMTSWFGIIDLLSVAPYYIELMLHQDTSVLFRFSILRMFRLLRVFKPFRYNHTVLLTIEVMYVSVRRSQHALFAIGFFVVMILTVFSTLLYFAERGTWDPMIEAFVNADGDPTQFSSIPAAGWFVLVTITTVGYGEITPRSFLGRLVTLPILVCGLLLITLPSFVLGREFSIVWEQMTSRLQGNENLEPESPVDSSIPFGYPPTPGGFAPGDLSNRKLAQNQTELSRQIEDLRTTVESQGAMLQRLLEVLDEQTSASKGKQVDRS